MCDRILYQTVEDRHNPDIVEQQGPFKCTNKNAWLGHGYYFWDTFISLAHWWGENYRNGYIICESSCDGNMELVYDLVGRPELFEEIETVATIIKDHNEAVTVYIPEVIKYLKCKTSFLKRYKAIRVNALNTLPNTEFRYKFNDKHRAFIDIRPAIQFCIFDKSFLNSEYRIVYPEEYCSESVM